MREKHDWIVCDGLNFGSGTIDGFIHERGFCQNEMFLQQPHYTIPKVR